MLQKIFVLSVVSKHVVDEHTIYNICTKFKINLVVFLDTISYCIEKYYTRHITRGITYSIESKKNISAYGTRQIDRARQFTMCRPVVHGTIKAISRRRNIMTKKEILEPNKGGTGMPGNRSAQEAIRRKLVEGKLYSRRSAKKFILHLNWTVFN